MADVVVPALATRARHHGLATCTLGDYAQFWQHREQVRLTATYDTATGVLELHTSASDLIGMTVTVEPGGTTSSVVLDGVAHPATPGAQLIVKGPR